MRKGEIQCGPHVRCAKAGQCVRSYGEAIQEGRDRRMDAVSMESEVCLEGEISNVRWHICRDEVYCRSNFLWISLWISRCYPFATVTSICHSSFTTCLGVCFVLIAMGCALNLGL